MPRSSTRLRSSCAVFVFGWLAVLSPIVLPAQQPVSVQPQPHVIRFWEGAVALGALSGLMLLDGPTQRFAQDNRTPTRDDVARGFRKSTALSRSAWSPAGFSAGNPK